MFSSKKDKKDPAKEKADIKVTAEIKETEENMVDFQDVIEETQREMEAEQIDAVRIYQSISFDKKNETYFSTRSSSKKSVKIEFHSFLSAIKISSETDSVIVPLTNVSAIYLKSPIKKEAIQAADDEAKNLQKISESQRDLASRPK